MKTPIKPSVPLLLLSIFSSLHPICHAQTTAFTYQGRLTEAGLSASGLYDFRAQLYDKAAPPGDALVSGTLELPAVPVTNGLFVLELDFGATVFNGAERWLNLQVRTNNALNFITLSPRQALAPTPYAIHAAQAASLQSGTAPVFTGTATFNPASGPPFNVGNTVKVPNLNADLLDGLDSSALVRKSGDTLTGNLTLAAPAALSFGNTARQMLNLWDTQYALGVQANTLYARSHRHFAWFRDGSHVDTALDPGPGGSILMQLSESGRLDVTGPSSSVTLNAVDFVGALSLFRGVKATSDSIFGTAVQGWSEDGTAISGVSANGTAGSFSGPLRVDMDSTVARPQLRLRETQDGDYARLEFQAASRPYWHIAVGGGAANQMNFYNSTNGDVMTLKEDGTLFVKVLTITGGADIAEPFKMTDAKLPEGSVVVIDEENPGHLKLSTRAYDTRVAGVISGAGGVRAGLSLQQQGVMEGDQPVALTGRVYVQADASNGPIKPGDLLTTSDMPGRAMKVTDHARAQGAILGKAMTRLPAGRGLVLTLVTLQ